MRARIRMVDGSVVTIDDFGVHDPRSITPEMQAFESQCTPILRDVSGGYFIGTEHSTGRLHAFVCANVSTICPVE